MAWIVLPELRTDGAAGSPPKDEGRREKKPREKSGARRIVQADPEGSLAGAWSDLRRTQKDPLQKEGAL
jgi:hypothetical protein